MNFLRDLFYIFVYAMQLAGGIFLLSGTIAIVLWALINIGN